MLRLISTKFPLNSRHVRETQQFMRNSTVAVTNEITNQPQKKKIIRPKKIDRGPTDLLYSLSATVGRDPTGKHYKYQDDPFLAPDRYTNREQFALSQESGKRTAQWIRDKHADLFNSDEAAPSIEAFIPKHIFTETQDFTLDHLKDAIESFNAADAAVIYRQLESKNIEIPLEIQEELLAVVAFNNHQNAIPFDMFEERAAKDTAEKRAHKTGSSEFAIQWRDNCFANILFNEMEQTPTAYNIMILGMYKYGAYEKALALFDRAKENQIPLKLETYNNYLKYLSHAGPIQTIETRWETVKSTLRELNDLRIKPNVHTLNAILSTIRSGGNFTKMPEMASQIIAEFQHINVEASLETYWHLLNIVYADRDSVDSVVLDEILDCLEKNPNIKAQSVGDLNFFPKAMNLCRYRLKNGSTVAYRLDAIVTHGDNVKFLGPSDFEQNYYRDYLLTILNRKPLDQFFELYDQLVPDILPLDFQTVNAILSVIDSVGEIKYIPKIWTDILASGIQRRTQEVMLNMISDNQPLSDDPNAMNLHNLFADIAWHLYEISINEDKRNAAATLLHAKLLSQIIVVLCRSNRFENASSVIERTLNQKKGTVVGCLTKDAVKSFIDTSIANKSAPLAIKLIAYTITMGLDNTVESARKLVQSLELSPNEMREITNLVGHDNLTN